jgi:tRNA-2-methylthio-N6-dimethylallyladenosine synthase
LHELQALIQQQQRSFNASMIGRTLPVLFEKQGRHHGQLIGRSPYLQGVHARADAALIGTVQPLKIVDATLNSLAGEHAPAHRDEAA